MTISNLKTTQAKRVMGMDCSTFSIAFCIMENRRPIKWGKINFDGADVFERMHDASIKIRSVKDEFDVDFIAFEAAILAKVGGNAATTIKLAMVYGACIVELMNKGVKVETVLPIVWQPGIGNPTFKKADKAALKIEHPNKSISWYGTEIRRIRKQRTMDFINGKWPEMNITDNDVGDACGIAYYSYYNLTHR